MTGRQPLDARRAGLLLHITSLPGTWGNGDLGPDAQRFVDLLVEAGQSVWQMLPLGPTHDDGSPYSCLSVHAGNPDLISVEALIDEGWIARAAAEAVRAASSDARAARRMLLAEAQAHFDAAASLETRREYHEFKAVHAHWLDDYVLYRALRERNLGQSWVDWPVALRDRQPAALEQARSELTQVTARLRFEQFLFFRQWSALRNYANARGVLMFGDMPIFVAHDSADVWAQRDYFVLDESGRPAVVAGVPPDYFSSMGQRWGNPLYRWERMAEDDYAWWRARLAGQLELFDLLRVDHFRGFEAYWEIPADEPTAINGRWAQGPGAALFDALHREFEALPLVAEDLGMITPEVNALRAQYHIPGMKVLQFAFEGGGRNPYLPHNHERESVVYTGTHDNDTSLGWFRGLAPGLQERVCDYLAVAQDADMPWPLIRSAHASVARLAVVPMQDGLALGSEHRMNTPGVAEGNWNWRFEWAQVPADMAARMRHSTELYGRLPDAGSKT